jgi:hypothetical protein
MRLIEAVTSQFTAFSKEQEGAEFFLGHPAPSAARTVQQCLKRIRINTPWLTNNRLELTAYLKTSS